MNACRGWRQLEGTGQQGTPRTELDQEDEQDGKCGEHHGEGVVWIEAQARVAQHGLRICSGSMTHCQ